MASKAAQKLKRGKVPKSCRASVMDESKALGIFGFSSRRWLDYSSGLTPKEELDKAHFAKMTFIMKKKVHLESKRAFWQILINLLYYHSLGCS